MLEIFEMFLFLCILNFFAVAIIEVCLHYFAFSCNVLFSDKNIMCILGIFFLIVPEEFMYNPLTRSYGEPHKRPEVQNSTVEFIASSDYMVKKSFHSNFNNTCILI